MAAKDSSDKEYTDLNSPTTASDTKDKESADLNSPISASDTKDKESADLNSPTTASDTKDKDLAKLKDDLVSNCFYGLRCHIFFAKSASWYLRFCFVCGIS